LIHIINSLKKDVSEEIKKIVGSSGIDIFIDTTGKPELIEKSYNLTKSGGKTIMVGQPKVGEHLTLHSFLQHFNEKVLLDSNGGLTDPDVDINRYLRLYKNGILKLDKLITKRVKLLDINKTLDIIRKDSSFSGRCVIDME
jgi:S-(hydroxymethyl)glutathione dehydrogenase/alcohol dehydrogenase